MKGVNEMWKGEFQKYIFCRHTKNILILPPGKGAGTAIGPAKVATMAHVEITKLRTKTILADSQLSESHHLHL